MIAAESCPARPAGLLRDLTRVVRAHLSRADRHRPPDCLGSEDILLRALCHDMSSPVSFLESSLGLLRRQTGSADHDDLLNLACAQASHLSSLLRTADATGGAAQQQTATTRPLTDVLCASVGASGLAADQLTVQCTPDAAGVAVADARVQRILVNLLENAHRHGDGAAVTLRATRRPGWVALAVHQTGLRPHQVVDHLFKSQPPTSLTGLGLWSVRQHTCQLGGHLDWNEGPAGLTLTVHLPDR